MYHIAKTHESISHPHAIRILNNFQGFTRKTLTKLEAQQFIQVKGSEWAMTKKGYEEAASMFNQIENSND